MNARRRIRVTTLSLSDFLLARYDEEVGWVAGRSYRMGRTFVLADVTAKRRIVERHTACDDTSFGQPCDDLRDLALPYVDHPDYREEWRP